MAIVAECPVCGKRFKADEKQAGKKAKCSKCANVFVVGAPTTTAAAPPDIAPRHPDVVTAPAPAPRAAEPPPPTRAAPAPAPAPAPPPPDPAAADAPAPRGRGKWVAIAAVLAVAGGAAVVFAPKLTGPKSTETAASSAPSRTTDRATRATAAAPNALVLAPALPPSSPAWSTEVDAPAAPLDLPDPFRLVAPGQPGMRYAAAGVTLAASPSPFAAVRLAPDADRAAPPVVEIWNLAAQSKSGQIRLTAPLAKPVLSQDGGYYAGHVVDDAARAVRVEVWSTAGQRVHTIDLPAAGAAADPVVGFPVQDQVAVIGEKLQVWDLAAKALVREVPLPAHGDDTRAAASARAKLVAVADAKSLTLVDLPAGKALGTAPIPAAVTAHPTRTLSLRALDFSPDGAELALVFDNRQSTRRVAIFDVATGRLKELLAPAVPVYDGGPDFQWTGDGRAFVVGSGILLDRATGRQIGEIYGDLADEGLGGALAGLVGGDRAVIAWDKYPRGLVVRAVPVRREKADWVHVAVESATAERYEQLVCFSRQFGNAHPRQTIHQTGRLADGSQFLVVDAAFTPTLADDAPDLVPFRRDQFALVADGQARSPIGTLVDGRMFSLEKPEYTLAKRGEAAPRRRAIVFAVTGKEQRLTLRIGSAETPLEMPPRVAAAAPPALMPVPAERVAEELFDTPDDTGAATVRVNFARLGPFELTPDADGAPLTVTYSSPERLLAVNFDLTVNGRRNIRTGAAQLGLLLPDGTLVHPSAELPGPLPIGLQPGEQRTQTCLFVLTATANRYRLTYDGVPVATVKADVPTARSLP